MDFANFFANYGLIILLGALLVFMFWSSRRRMAKQKAEQEAKARQTVPGAEVLLQGGLYGTIVEYDPDNLDKPAIVELAPGVDIKVHSQAILRVVEPSAIVSDHESLELEDGDGELDESDPTFVSLDKEPETRADAAAESDDSGTETKPQV